jgi:AcrR family transcriptional regulator
MVSKVQTNDPLAEPKCRGRQRSLEAQSAVLAATSKLLEKKCLCKVTTEAIALLSGVSKATIYKWWPNKTLVALDAFLMHMTDNVPTPDTGSAQKDFTEQMKSLMAFYTSSAGKVFCQFIAEGQSDPAFLALFCERFLKSRRNDVRIIWQRGVARGEIRNNVDSEVVLDLIYGPVVFRLLTGHGQLNAREAEALVSAVFSGIEKPPRSSRSQKAR